MQCGTLIYLDSTWNCDWEAQGNITSKTLKKKKEVDVDLNKSFGNW